MGEQQKIHPWMLSYVKQHLRFRRQVQEPRHIILSICDHFEPLWHKADDATGLQRVKVWTGRYAEIAKKYKDADGQPLKYTFFYPVEEYRKEYLNCLSDLCHAGRGEVEVHLHHDNDTAENLRKTLLDYTQMLACEHRLLSREKNVQSTEYRVQSKEKHVQSTENGEQRENQAASRQPPAASSQIRYGFIHGNWALDNSRPDGRWCGVNNELDILQETGCYADFTMPSAPSPTQTTKINSIYYSVDNPNKPKSHNAGKGSRKSITDQKGLMMVQGPLMLNWHTRKYKILPKIENGLIDHSLRFAPERVKLWLEAGVSVQGRPDCIFIKLHTHGCQEKNTEALLGHDLEALLSHMCQYYNDGKNYVLHFASAREMYNIIKALEADEPGDIGQYRDYRLVRCSEY